MSDVQFVTAGPSDTIDADALIVPLFDDGVVPGSLPAATASLIGRMAPDVQALPRYGAITHFGLDGRILAIKAGPRTKLDKLALRRLISAAIKSLWPTQTRTVTLYLVDIPLAATDISAAAVGGVIYAMWRPELRTLESVDGSKPVAPLERVTLVTGSPEDATSALERAVVISDAVNLARRLSNESANRMTPTDVAREAADLAARTGLTCEILDRDACRALGMGSYLSVAQGSAEPPAFVVLRHRGRGGDGYGLALVGKGITFDSGGISLKQNEWMLHMKADMTGAAAVIAAMGAIATLKVPVDVIGIAPCTENMPSGTATKVGDIFRSMSGVTVEVRNTDGEGRLALIDAVTFACREGARRVVDIASLTLAVAGGYGDEYVGVFGEPPAFVDEVTSAAATAGERFWPLPISDEVRDQIKSDVADITNSIGTVYGGGAAGAAFIERGLTPGVAWTHLDLGRTYWSDVERPYSPKGPLGSGVRTMVALAEATASD